MIRESTWTFIVGNFYKYIVCVMYEFLKFH